MQTQTNRSSHTENELPAVAAIITHEVEDYPRWKRAFDHHAGTRKQAGIFVTHINHSAENPNLLTVYVGARDADQLGAFLSSSDLKNSMKDATVKGPPQIALVNPVEDMTQRRPLAGAVVIHAIADFDTWKAAFDAHAVTRAEAGVIGHAVNRSVENPNLVVVYLQCESLDDLKTYTSSSDLKAIMKNAGVQGRPDIKFVNAGSWGN